jgi:hypothetical protein
MDWFIESLRDQAEYNIVQKLNKPVFSAPTSNLAESRASSFV